MLRINGREISFKVIQVHVYYIWSPFLPQARKSESQGCQVGADPSMLPLAHLLNLWANLPAHVSFYDPLKLILIEFFYFQASFHFWLG